MKWEYTVALVPSNLRAEWIDELGQQGWELAAMSGDIVYFKRPAEPKPPDILIVNVSDRDIGDIARQIKEALANQMQDNSDRTLWGDDAIDRFFNLHPCP